MHNSAIFSEITSPPKKVRLFFLFPFVPIIFLFKFCFIFKLCIKSNICTINFINFLEFIVEIPQKNGFLELLRGCRLQFMWTFYIIFQCSVSLINFGTVIMRHLVQSWAFLIITKHCLLCNYIIHGDYICLIRFHRMYCFSSLYFKTLSYHCCRNLS